MVSRKWSVLVCQVSCHTCLVLLALSSWTVVLCSLGLRHRYWVLLARLLWKVFSQSGSAKLDASACLLGTLLVASCVGARLLGTLCVTGVGGCLPGLSGTIVLSKLKC